MPTYSYFAGFFDGEGTVSIKNGKKGWQIRASITNTNFEILNLFKDEFGGSLYKRSKFVNKQTYVWEVSSKQAFVFLQRITPFLIEKKRKATLAIEFQSKIKREKTIMTEPEIQDRLKFKMNFQKGVVCG